MSDTSVRRALLATPLALVVAAATACAGAPAAAPPAVPSDAQGAAAGAEPDVQPPSPVAKAPAPPARPKVAPGVSARWVVYDRRTGKTLSRNAARKTVRSASVVKLLIAMDYLGRRKGEVAPAHAARFAKMLRASDDAAATYFWNLGGKGAIVTRMKREIGLKDSAPPPADKPGFWGYTAISAGDVAASYRYLLDRSSPKVRKTILGHLAKATGCGTDGFDQSWGLPSATKRAHAVKQGWSGFGLTPPYACRNGARALPAALPAAGPDLGLGRPVLHTTGTVGARDRYIVVVLTLNPAGASYRTSGQRLTALTKALVKGL
ncbi:hypothetical protein LO762_22655 [Actinocorallia sp. API 0066]|uniref:hypothetical protein n=1 Tax=Actinocorallia sp. API 0066 TaxID=2896846 RepID=UPI001E3A1043|nr:hypothetical protein [Actinocorallia sp. API 0066]MCD0451973.1 hypothetical protein [Actinocorallia sp. API 0066]